MSVKMLPKMLLMSTHNIHICEEIRKISNIYFFFKMLASLELCLRSTICRCVNRMMFTYTWHLYWRKYDHKNLF